MFLILKPYFNNNVLDNDQEVWGMQVSKVVVCSVAYTRDFPWPGSDIPHTMMIFFPAFL